MPPEHRTDHESFVPAISSQEPAWLRDITIKGGSAVTPVLPSVRVLLDRKGGDAALPDGGGPLLEAIARDPHPIPIADDRELYHFNDDVGYWISGYRDFMKVASVCSNFGMPLVPGRSVLDMGCASGRVLRHLLTQKSSLRVWGCDIKLRHIEWVRRFLPSRCRLIHCTQLPSLPIPDESLDVIYAFSVFSHIDEFESAWLAELSRCLRRDGLAILSIHSNDTWKMIPQLPLLAKYTGLANHIPDYTIVPQLFEQDLPRDKTVLWWNTAPAYNCDVYYHVDYIRREWGRFFDVLDIERCGHNYQDLVVLRKPD